MKLIYAGQGESAQPYSSLLFNCIRNKACQKPFYVPVNLFSDIQFYVDLPGIPDTVEIEIEDACNSENTGSVVSASYVTGDTIAGNYYGVFGGLIVTPPVGVTYSKFFFKFKFTVDGDEHFYYSEMFEFPVCEDLKFLRGCYPFVDNDVDAVDCNGIYYGFPYDSSSGDATVRYIHWAFLRMASVIEQRNKMTFTAFNNKRIYKTIFNREHLLEFEFVPTFYKDILVGIFNRGNIQLEGVEWKLAETQDISIIDVDSKLWKMDMILDSECKQTFGCSVPNCLPPVPVDCDPVAFDPEVDPPALPDGTVGVPYSYSFNLVGTAPFNLTVNEAPAWMSINIVGNVVSFTGTPTEFDEEAVDITITNCSEDYSINFDDGFVVLDCVAQGTITNNANPQVIISMTVNGVPVNYLVGNNFPIPSSGGIGDFESTQTGNVVDITVGSDLPIPNMTYVDTDGVPHSPTSGGGSSYTWNAVKMVCGGDPWQIIGSN